MNAQLSPELFGAGMYAPSGREYLFPTRPSVSVLDYAQYPHDPRQITYSLSTNGAKRAQVELSRDGRIRVSYLDRSQVTTLVYNHPGDPDHNVGLEVVNVYSPQQEVVRIEPFTNATHGDSYYRHLDYVRQAMSELGLAQMLGSLPSGQAEQLTGIFATIHQIHDRRFIADLPDIPRRFGIPDDNDKLWREQIEAETDERMRKVREREILPDETPADLPPYVRRLSY